MTPDEHLDPEPPADYYDDAPPPVVEGDFDEPPVTLTRCGAGAGGDSKPQAEGQTL